MIPHARNPEIIEDIRLNYKGTPQSKKLLAQKHNISVGTVAYIAIRAGVTKGRKYNYSNPVDDERLRELSRQVTQVQAATIMGLSVTAVKSRTHVLGLKWKSSHDEWYNVKELQWCTGIHWQTITKYIKEGKLQATVHSDNKSAEVPLGGACYKISEQSIKNFIKQYPGVLQGRLVDMVWLVDLLCNGLYYSNRNKLIPT